MPKANYYESPNVNAYPSSNATDNGKLNLEENITQIVTRLTKRNYCLSKDDFKLSKVGNKISIGTGKVNISGYLVDASKQISIDFPDSSYSTGKLFIGMRLAYDGSNHILGDMGLEDGTKYFNGSYITWMKESEITDDTFILGSANWNGTDISNILENPDKTMIFNTKNIIVEPEVNLEDFIKDLPNVYIHRHGDKAYDGKGGNIYGNLLFMTDPSDSSYGIKSGVSNQDESNIEIKPLSKTANQYKVSLGSNNTRSYLKLGLGSLSYIVGNSKLSIEGCPVSIDRETEINNTLDIKNEDTNFKFDNNEFKSTRKTNNISNFHTDNTSTIEFSKTDKSKYIDLEYNYTSGELSFKGLSSTINFITDVSLNDLYINKSKNIKFKDNTLDFINYNSFQLGTSTNNMSYNSTGLKLKSDESQSLRLEGSKATYSELFNTGLLVLTGNSSTSPGIKFTSEVIGSLKSVLLSCSPGTDELKVTGSLKVDGDITTVNGGKVYNAVYNDGVEFFEKSNKNDIINPGDIVCVDNNGLCKKVSSNSDRERVIGVCSSPETYGFVLGGDKLEESEKVPVGLFGRLYVNTNDKSITAGDILVPDNNGNAVKIENFISDSKYIIGMAMNSPKDGKVYIKIK